MIPLFLGLTAVNWLCLLTAAALGYSTPLESPRAWIHIFAGAVATLTCCAVHCVVFTYFVATAKWVQHAVTVKGLDPGRVAPTRSFKAQAFPAALAAIAAVFVAAVLGAVADNYHGSWHLRHHVSAILAVVINLAVAPIEYRAIARNGRLIDGVLESIAAQSPSKRSGGVESSA